LDQAAGLELGEMRTGGLRRVAGLMRQLARGQRAAGHQRGEHVGARGIADQRSDHCDIGTCFHSSMLAEASSTFKRILSPSTSWRGAQATKQSILPLPVNGLLRCARNDGENHWRTT